MNIIIAKDAKEASEIASGKIIEEINTKKSLVLGLATGDTPLQTYKRLIEAYQKGTVDFTDVKTFNLDEYLGLPKEDVNSYNYYMHTNLFDHINIKKENIHLLSGFSDDFTKTANNYDEMIDEYNGIDLQVLGIGVNGHIGFNEPNSKLTLETHVTDLTQATLEQNSKFFPNIDEMPKQAITMGLGTIMKAKKIILIATGIRKANIIAQFLNSNEIDTYTPVSTLLLHNDLTVILDEEAASRYLEEKKMIGNENFNKKCSNNQRKCSTL